MTVSIGRGPHASRRALVGVALGYGACVAVCSYVAVRDGVPGRPLGIGVPLSVPTSLVAGWGIWGLGALADAGDRGGGCVAGE